MNCSVSRVSGSSVDGISDTVVDELDDSIRSFSVADFATGHVHS